MKPKSSLRELLWPALFLFVPFSLWIAFLEVCVYSGGVSIRYPDMVLEGDRQQVWFLATGELFFEPKEIADLYLKDGNGKVYRLQTLTESTVESWIDWKDVNPVLKESNPPISRSERDGQQEITIEIDGPYPSHTDHFKFRDGRLLYASFHTSTRFQFGRTADGDFLSLPASHKEMRRIFGSRYSTKHHKKETLVDLF